MPASYTPGPEEPDHLSAREQKILAAIEDELRTTDPTLAWRLARTGSLSISTRVRAAARRAALLAVALLVLIVTTAVMTPSGWAVLGLLTVLLVVPATLWYATEHHNND